MSLHNSPTDNQLLAALPAFVLRRWLPQLAPVNLAPGQVLHVQGSRPTHAYFPTTAVVAQMFGASVDTSIEVALIGNEGMTGIALALGSETVPCSVVVQCVGGAWCIPAQALIDEFERSLPVRTVLLSFAQALITQTAQAAVCNRHLSLERRLCYWLLMMLDRQGGNELAVTQDHIAHNLGMRREGVTQGAHHLQELGLISGSRGRIRVLDREGLKRHACECYAVVSREYERLLPVQAAA
jgi:CRP-like cAMP-binding protein